MIYCSCIKADDNISWMISSNIYDSWYKSTAFPLTLCCHEHRPVETSKTMPFFSGSISHCSGFVESQNRVPVEFFSQKASPCRCSNASLSLAVWHSSPMDPVPYSWQISMKEWRNMKDREWYSDDLPMDQGGMWAGFLKNALSSWQGKLCTITDIVDQKRVAIDLAWLSSQIWWDLTLIHISKAVSFKSLALQWLASIPIKIFHKHISYLLYVYK